jgi:hypothetical protein
MAGDGKGSRSLKFQGDETGALRPASMLEPAEASRVGHRGCRLVIQSDRFIPWISG